MYKITPDQGLPQRVSIASRARLHLGFLDMSGALGRRFGSLGLSIEAFQTRMSVSAAPAVQASGPGAPRAQRFAQQLLHSLGMQTGVDIRLEQSIPDHLGLGSGTQMALTVGRAISELYGLQLDTARVAGLLKRGMRSGIGIGAFDQGGFLLDSGVGENGEVPPITARLDYPNDWRVLLILDARGQGLHGKQEFEAFKRLPPFPKEVAAHLCHLTLMQILPGLRERQLVPVAEGIAELQRRVGDHFAAAQGGRFTSPAVAKALAWAEAEGFGGVGQSSWGPTGFVLTPDAGSAEALVSSMQQRFGELSPLRFKITAAANRGSHIQPEWAVDTVKDAR